MRRDTDIVPVGSTAYRHDPDGVRGDPDEPPRVAVYGTPPPGATTHDFRDLYKSDSEPVVGDVDAAPVSTGYEVSSTSIADHDPRKPVVRPTVE